jgi:hypothetical protein
MRCLEARLCQWQVGFDEVVLEPDLKSFSQAVQKHGGVVICVSIDGQAHAHRNIGMRPNMRMDLSCGSNLAEQRLLMAKILDHLHEGIDSGFDSAGGTGAPLCAIALIAIGPVGDANHPGLP